MERLINSVAQQSQTAFSILHWGTGIGTGEMKICFVYSKSNRRPVILEVRDYLNLNIAMREAFLHFLFPQVGFPYFVSSIFGVSFLYMLTIISPSLIWVLVCSLLFCFHTHSGGKLFECLPPGLLATVEM